MPEAGHYASGTDFITVIYFIYGQRRKQDIFISGKKCKKYKNP